MRGERGAAAIEAAIILPILILLIIGAAEYGIYFLQSYETEQVAYEAARAGASAAGDAAAKETAATTKAESLIASFGLSKKSLSVTVDTDYTAVSLTCAYTPVTSLVPVPDATNAIYTYKNY